jgi:hypothetical protein
MTYTCPACELAADTYLLKFRRLKIKFLCTSGNFPRFTPIHDLHTACNLSYVYVYITKLCRQQAELIKYHGNEHVRIYDKAKPDIGNIRGLNLAAVKLTTIQVTSTRTVKGRPTAEKGATRTP